MVGGRNEDQTLLSTAESFSGSSGTWTSLDNITDGKIGHCQVDTPDFQIITFQFFTINRLVEESLGDSLNQIQI